MLTLKKEIDILVYDVENNTPLKVVGAHFIEGNRIHIYVEGYEDE